MLYLRFAQAIPFERLARLMSDLLGLEISEGALANMLEASGGVFARQTSLIRDRLLSGTILQSDETSQRAGRQQDVVDWVFHNGDSACFLIRPSRGKAVVGEFLGAVRPPVELVPGLTEELCDYVNDNFETKPALHLAAYVMWRINWIHPFADGNGHTARAASYLVLCAHLKSRLPGKPTIPELIAQKKQDYYRALEAADKAWADNRIDLAQLEQLLEAGLSAQLVSTVEQARGQPLP